MFTIFDSDAGLALASEPKPKKESRSERLYRDLQSHRNSQAGIMAETKRAKDLAKTPLAEYLLQVVGENETRQAEVLGRLAASLRDALSWSHSAEALPDRASGPERAETIASVRDLLRLEQARARSARRLAKAYAGIGDGLEQTLLEASATVAESNARLLRAWVRNFTAGTVRATSRAGTNRRPSVHSEQDANGQSTTASDQDASPPLAA